MLNKSLKNYAHNKKDFFIIVFPLSDQVKTVYGLYFTSLKITFRWHFQNSSKTSMQFCFNFNFNFIIIYIHFIYICFYRYFFTFYYFIILLILFCYSNILFQYWCKIWQLSKHMCARYIFATFVLTQGWPVFAFKPCI